ncbi:class I SAM-dependent methyltransferase [Archangium sp.]|uniref:class I SAM-dependent methyltransferase n=1 Tax=Archangium sp. TaxID=1872627 RepID=UPI002D2D8BA0|nr:class I SAM-dependent methyltransferase [Archangium sp.]HYO51739.1 class I SAM-dependent methyltransferase [Archangium sp.]
MGNLRWILRQAFYGPWDALHDWRLTGTWLGSTAAPVTTGSFYTESTSYIVLSYLFRRFPIAADDVLVDVGCGRGRVLRWWLSRGLRNRMFGLEINSSIAAEAQQLVSSFPNAKVITGDALEHLPEDGTIFYLFNPFHEQGVVALKEKLAHRANPHRPVRIIYHTACFAHVFQNDPRWDVRIERLPLPLMGDLPLAWIQLRT